MPNVRTPRGITPPAPGLEREEPMLVNERDIPTSDSGSERGAASEERPAKKSERE